MAKTAGSATTHYHYDQNGRLIAESDDSGSVTREHIALDGLPLALIDHGGSSPVIQTVHADHLGTPQIMTDAAKAVVWDAVMTPFGVMHSLTGSAANDNRLPGQRLEPETGLHYNYFRDYDPDLGRYIQSDPIGLRGGLNTYAYVGGDPVNYIDPEGLEAIFGSGGIGADECEATQEEALVAAGVTAAPLCLANPIACGRAIVAGAKKVAKVAKGFIKDEAGGRKIKGGHKTKKRPSSKSKHEKGDARRGRDQFGEKGDLRRPYHKSGKSAGK